MIFSLYIHPRYLSSNMPTDGGCPSQGATGKSFVFQSVWKEEAEKQLPDDYSFIAIQQFNMTF